MRLEPDRNETMVTYVEPGETLSEIAARYGVSVEELQRWNPIENPDLIQSGQTIVVHKPELLTYEGMVSFGDVWIEGAIFLALLLLVSWCVANLFRSKYGAIAPAPQVNDGEKFVRQELKRRYGEWILLNDVMLPSGRGTTQIDHILVSPGGVFLIETKDMNGWVFGSPGQKQWTQTFMAGRWSRMVAIKSKRFKFYNPLLQNEGHANALVNLGIAKIWWLRPIVVFVGDAELKTSDKFLPFDEHEKMASKNRTWRMRGVVCMGLAGLHRYIDFSVDAPSNPGLTRQAMEKVHAKIRAAAIPVTAESHARHVEYVRSAKDEAQR